MDSELKGKFAEAIVEYMFRASGRNIFQIGIKEEAEKFLKYLGKCKQDLLPWQKDFETARFHRGIRVPVPDFAVVCSGVPELIEVKYRSFNNFEREMELFWEHIKPIQVVWDSAIILVTRDKIIETGHFSVIHDENDYVAPLDKENWQINHDVFRECEEMVKQIFTH